MLLVRRLVILLAAAACFVEPAWAEDWVVVLDHGMASKEQIETYRTKTLRLIEVLALRGDRVKLVALGADAEGRSRGRDLKAVVNEADPARRLARLKEHASVTGYELSGLTDIRTALRLAAQVHQKKDPLRVALIGAFGGTGSPSEAARREWDRDAKYWQDTAPEDVKVYWIDHPFPSPMPANLRGAVEKAWLVLAFEKPHVATFGGWSPFADPAWRLRGFIMIGAEVWTAGTATGFVPGLVGVKGSQDDELRLEFIDDEQKVFIARPALIEPHKTRVSFHPWTDDTVTLCPVPQTVHLEWPLAEAAVLETEDGRPLLVHAHRPPVGGHEEHHFRLRRTNTEHKPEWSVQIVGAEENGRWFDLEVEVGEERVISEFVVEAPVTVSVRARKGVAVEAIGTIELSSTAGKLEILFDIKVPPGKATLQYDGPTSLRLPRAADDSAVTLTLRGDNEYAPDRLQLVAECFPPELRELLHAVIDGGVWDLMESRTLQVGRPFELRLDLQDPECWRDMSMGMITFRLKEGGVEVAGEHRIALEPRRPVLLPVDVTAVPHVLVKKGAFDVQVPLELVVNADGGGGVWKKAREAVPPTVEVLEGTSITDWNIESMEGGRWRITPAGAPMMETSIFDDAQAWVKIRVHWPEDALRQVNYDYEVLVEAPARWGLWAYVLLGLAGVALLLGVFAFVQLRAPLIAGTLLYTIDGVDGVVGRLDLRPVGRKTTAVRRDEHGKLHLEGDGEPIATIVATRVGGSLEIDDESGGKDRRLLVDGLAVRVGKHRLRYMSGQPSEAQALPLRHVPDLIGPEYDLTSGRIDAVGRDDDAEG